MNTKASFGNWMCGVWVTWSGRINGQNAVHSYAFLRGRLCRIISTCYSKKYRAMEFRVLCNGSAEVCRDISMKNMKRREVCSKVRIAAGQSRRIGISVGRYHTCSSKTYSSCIQEATTAP